MSNLEDHEAEQAEITAEWEARAEPYLPRPVTNPKRFYVTLTWDNWPEGGSFGTIVTADDWDDAEHAARWEMANHREEFDHPVECIESCGDDWHLVDCWDLDEFIAEKRQDKCVTQSDVLWAIDKLTFGQPKEAKEFLVRAIRDASPAPAS